MIDYNTSDTYKLQDIFSNDQVEDLKDSLLFSEITSKKRSYGLYTTNEVFVKLTEKGVNDAKDFTFLLHQNLRIYLPQTK